MKNLLEFADAIGCPIVDRAANDGGVYNGKNIANHFIGHVFEAKQVNRKKYTRSVKKTKYNLTQHNLLHELCHYLIASDDQRKLTDYGLGPVSFLNGPRDNQVIYTSHIHLNDQIIDDDTGDVQDLTAHLLAQHL